MRDEGECLKKPQNDSQNARRRQGVAPESPGHALAVLLVRLFVHRLYDFHWRDAMPYWCRVRNCGHSLDCFKRNARCHFRENRFALQVKCARCVSFVNSPLVRVRRWRSPWWCSGADSEPFVPRKMDESRQSACRPGHLRTGRHAFRGHSARIFPEGAHVSYSRIDSLLRLDLADCRQ